DEKDYFLDTFQVAQKRLFYASDFFDLLLKRSSLAAADFCLHPFSCAVFGHNRAILIHQHLYPENFPDEAAIARQTVENPYNGIVGKETQAFVLRRASGLAAANPQSSPENKTRTAVAPGVLKTQWVGHKEFGLGLRLIPPQEPVALGGANR